MQDPQWYSTNASCIRFFRPAGGNSHNFHSVVSPVSSILLLVYSSILDSFLICIYWSFSPDYLRETPLQSHLFSVQFFSLQYSVLKTPGLLTASSEPHIIEPSVLYHNVLTSCVASLAKRKVVAIISLTQFVSHFTRIPMFCCLMPTVLQIFFLFVRKISCLPIFLGFRQKGQSNSCYCILAANEGLQVDLFHFYNMIYPTF